MFCFLVLTLCVLGGQAGNTCRNVVSLGEEDLTITEEVARDKEFEVDVETNLRDDGKQALLVRTELLEPVGEEETSPLYFNVGQAGIMKGWQVFTKQITRNKFQ